MPHTLTYDTLPPQSTLRREVHDGVVKIIAAAEEPTAVTRSLARRKTVLPAAILAAALMFVFLAALASTFLGNRRNIGIGLMLVLAIAFAIFCAALFLFVWRITYTSQLDAIAEARKQMTILVLSPGRILVESAGPFGTVSRESDSLADARVGWFIPLPTVRCLELHAPDLGRMQIFPGRDREELMWILRLIQNLLVAAPADRTIP